LSDCRAKMQDVSTTVAQISCNSRAALLCVRIQKVSQVRQIMPSYRHRKWISERCRSCWMLIMELDENYVDMLKAAACLLVAAAAVKKQESLANAKVSRRATFRDILETLVYEGPWRRNLWKINARNIIFVKYIHWVTTLSLTIRVYLYLFSSCCLSNLQNPAKFSENSNLSQFKVIQGHRSWCQSKARMQFPISH